MLLLHVRPPPSRHDRHPSMHDHHPSFPRAPLHLHSHFGKPPPSTDRLPCPSEKKKNPTALSLLRSENNPRPNRIALTSPLPPPLALTTRTIPSTPPSPPSAETPSSGPSPPSEPHPTTHAQPLNPVNHPLIADTIPSPGDCPSSHRKTLIDALLSASPASPHRRRLLPMPVRPPTRTAKDRVIVRPTPSTESTMSYLDRSSHLHHLHRLRDAHSLLR